LGALNAVTHDVITVTTLTYLNSQSVCQLLVKLAKLSLQVPITLVLDNARYQRCALVQSVADSLGIELLYFTALFAQLELDRAALEVGQKALSLLKVLRRLYGLHTRY
jgi:hypothetical protein